MKSVIVVPTIRERSINKFLEVWDDEFKDQIVIVIEDNPEPSFNISGPGVKHFSWANIDADLGEDSWIIPRKTDCIRSYGFLKAFQEKSVDMIVTLDDDCYPHSPGFLEEHYEKLNSPAISTTWILTGRGVATRGVPYKNHHRVEECVINHGLWTNVPDFDAITQLANIRTNEDFDPIDQVIPVGSYFPMCGMNLAFKPQVTPAMYFLLMGNKWPFDRFGDIWCGIFIKKICDHLGFGVKSGDPLIEHQKASNVWANLRKEAPGYEVNETLWREVDSVILTHDTFKDCYLELAIKLSIIGEYWNSLKEAMRKWAELF